MDTFPNIRPDRVSVGMVHHFEDGDIQSQADVLEIVRLLYHHAEREFYFFHQESVPWPAPLGTANASHGGDGPLLLNDAEFRYFRAPNSNSHGDFIKVSKHEELHGFGWEAPLVQAGPEFCRYRIQLTESSRRSLQIQEHIERERLSSGNPLELKPNFFGLGIDLKKAWAWLLRRFRNLPPRA
jgi:hypothetical protein